MFRINRCNAPSVHCTFGDCPSERGSGQNPGFEWFMARVGQFIGKPDAPTVSRFCDACWNLYGPGLLDGTRTHNLQIPSLSLSQLSYQRYNAASSYMPGMEHIQRMVILDSSHHADDASGH